MAKASVAQRTGSATTKPPVSQVATPSDIETEMLNNNNDDFASLARTQSSKPPSSSRTRSSKTLPSSASKNLTSPSGVSLTGAKHSVRNTSLNKVDISETKERNSDTNRKKKSAALRTASTTYSSVQSRALKCDSRTASSGSINTITSHKGDPVSDGSDEEQDIKFFDVQSQSLQSSRASSKLSSRSSRGSATQKKQDNGKKQYKTIDPEEIVCIHAFKALDKTV